MIIIGIDPGARGGIAIYDETEHNMILHKCPETTREMSAILESAKANALINNQEISCAIEKVHAFPTDARSSAFKFGMNFGMWLGVLGANKIPVLQVTPQRWMKDFQPLPKIKQERKAELKRIASEMLPENKITLMTSDAALIAAWYSRYNEQN
jgi:hypothetical protein